MDSNFFKNPRNEYIVIVNHDANIIHSSEYHDGRRKPVPEVQHWLEINYGRDNTSIQDVTSDFPWRWRVWQLGRSDAFFFYSFRQAQLFLLRWT